MNIFLPNGDTFKSIHLDNTSSINRDILNGFLSMNEDQYQRMSHLIKGRYENIYINSDDISALQALLIQIKREISSYINVQTESIKFGFWFNAMQPEQSTSRHCHDDFDEVLSGVYYIKVPENSGDLILYANDTCTIKPEEGLLVLFSPALEHEVLKNESQEMRLSIGFNACIYSPSD